MRSKLASQHDWSGEVLLGPLARATVCLNKAVLRLVRGDGEGVTSVDELQDEGGKKRYAGDEESESDVGGEWFYALLEAETPRTRDYTPTRKVRTACQHAVRQFKLSHFDQQTRPIHACTCTQTSKHTRTRIYHGRCYGG